MWIRLLLAGSDGGAPFGTDQGPASINPGENNAERAMNVLRGRRH